MNFFLYFARPSHNFSNGPSLNQNLNETFIFLNKKQALLYSTSSPRTLEIAFYSFETSNFSGGAYPETHLEKGN